MTGWRWMPICVVACPFADPSADGDHIPGAVTSTGEPGVTRDRIGFRFMPCVSAISGRGRWIEDNSVRSSRPRSPCVSATVSIRRPFAGAGWAACLIEVHERYRVLVRVQLPGETMAQLIATFIPLSRQPVG